MAKKWSANKAAKDKTQNGSFRAVNSDCMNEPFYRALLDTDTHKKAFNNLQHLL